MEAGYQSYEAHARCRTYPRHFLLSRRRYVAGDYNWVTMETESARGSMWHAWAMLLGLLMMALVMLEVLADRTTRLPVAEEIKRLPLSIDAREAVLKQLAESNSDSDVSREDKSAVLEGVANTSAESLPRVERVDFLKDL